MSGTPGPEPALPEDLAELIESCVESRSVEYKTSMPWHEAQFKVVKAALAMANLAGGGRVVLGVAEDAKGGLRPEGMSPEHYDSYKPDVINDRIRVHADPPFSVTVHRGAVDAKLFVIIEVPPFRDIPIICRRGGGASSELREGAIYTRSIHKPETTEVRGHAEMREIIDRAVDKGIARLLERFPQLGGDDREAFRRERGVFE